MCYLRITPLQNCLLNISPLPTLGGSPSVSLNYQFIPSGISFVIGLTTVLAPHTTLATRGWPSLPGYTSVTCLAVNTLSENRAESRELHHQLLDLGFRMSTLVGCQGQEHIFWAIFSSLEVMSWTFCHHWHGWKVAVSTDSGANCPPIWPCKKWLGVNGTLDLSSDKSTDGN